MRVSQRLDYVLSALVLLATRPERTFVAAGDLAGLLGLPPRFVEQQITALARAGIVESRRGPGGGCALARPAAQISVEEVVVALEGEVLDVPQRQDSATHELWRRLAVMNSDYLSSVDLATLAARQREIDGQSTPMYYI